MAKSTHYVDDPKFLQAFKNYLPIVRPLREEHNKICAKLKKTGVKKRDLPKFVRPKTPDYEFIGECLLKIAQHLSTKWNWTKYTYKDDMVGDAIENAVNYLENFNPDVYTKPFAYFTEIMKYAFLRRKDKEDKHSYIKQKMLEKGENLYVTQSGDVGSYQTTYKDFLKEVKNDIVVNFEGKKAEKKTKAIENRPKKEPKPKSKGVDEFFVDITPEEELLEQ